MISKEQLICDFADYLESKNLVDEFIEIFVAKADREEYRDLINGR